MTKKLLHILIASATVGISGSALATTIVNLDHPAGIANFGGFDWSSNGLALSTPGPVYHTGDVITTLYYADAVALNKPAGGTLGSANMVNGADGLPFVAGGYEYTVVASITETIDCGGPVGTTCTGAAAFYATGGTYNVYYDYFGLAGGGTVASQVAGTGFTDGISLLSGTINPGFAGIFTPTTTGGTGSFTFTASVSTTNGTYIQPNLTGTTAGSELKFGTDRTVITPPSTGTPTGGLPDSYIRFQADGNQSFSVPEPGSLALLGISMLGLVAVGGRRKQN